MRETRAREREEEISFHVGEIGCYCTLDDTKGKLLCSFENQPFALRYNERKHDKSHASREDLIRRETIFLILFNETQATRILV